MDFEHLINLSIFAIVIKVQFNVVWSSNRVEIEKSEVFVDLAAGRIRCKSRIIPSHSQLFWILYEFGLEGILLYLSLKFSICDSLRWHKAKQKSHGECDESFHLISIYYIISLIT